MSKQMVKTRDLRVSPIKAGDPAPLVSLFKQLTAIRALYHQAQATLEATIGVPICTSCGYCCERTSVAATELEVQYLMSELMGGDPKILKQVIDRSEGWLLERHADAPTYEGTKDFSDDQAMLKKLLGEADSLLIHQPCPYLTTEKLCLIHDYSPLICIAYGVTRVPCAQCSRPYGKGESPGVRAHIEGRWGDAIGAAMARMNGTINQMPKPLAQSLMQTGFLPVLLFGSFRPQKMAAYITDNKIATCKFVHFVENPAILWQNQLDRMWDMEHIVRGS